MLHVGLFQISIEITKLFIGLILSSLFNQDNLAQWYEPRLACERDPVRIPSSPEVVLFFIIAQPTSVLQHTFSRACVTWPDPNRPEIQTILGG